MLYYYRNGENKEDHKEYDMKESVCPPPEKILKVGFAIFLCIVVFGSGFIGRITLHILIWHINPPIESTISAINTLGGLLEPNCSTCVNETSCTRYTDSTAVDESWIWALFLVMIAPYFLTFISTLFRIFFKSNKAINWKVLLAVSWTSDNAMGIFTMAHLIVQFLIDKNKDTNDAETTIC